MVDALLWGGSAARRGSSSLLLFTTCSYNKGCNAEIAQLVEHNLAKVGVASSSLVFRSKSSSLNTCPGGGIGRRARFRCVCRKACRFDSCSGHYSNWRFSRWCDSFHATCFLFMQAWGGDYMGSLDKPGKAVLMLLPFPNWSGESGEEC